MFSINLYIHLDYLIQHFVSIKYVSNKLGQISLLTTADTNLEVTQKKEDELQKFASYTKR
ncbi:recombinase XerC [Halalkalibacillus sediminis]|uniref:Recombinase XerC n=1 Tax=Halalkalibacillus sediminis TaxID=2018042 RepID=A0A2I0QUW4_9BACI|nr:recombinase XerC [Halalkalibacillus sediminis]